MGISGNIKHLVLMLNPLCSTLNPPSHVEAKGQNCGLFQNLSISEILQEKLTLLKIVWDAMVELVSLIS